MFFGPVSFNFHGFLFFSIIFSFCLRKLLEVYPDNSRARQHQLFISDRLVLDSCPESSKILALDFSRALLLLFGVGRTAPNQLQG